MNQKTKDNVITGIKIVAIMVLILCGGTITN